MQIWESNNSRLTQDESSDSFAILYSTGRLMIGAITQVGL